MTENIIRVVGCDPGYRNLAIVVFDFDIVGKAVTLSAHLHIDIGSMQRHQNICVGLHERLAHSRIFQKADFVVIEDQMMGKNTVPVNQGVMWQLAATALHQSPHTKVEFMRPRRKFAAFKTIPLPHSMARDNKSNRRCKIKTNSIALTSALLTKYKIKKDDLFVADRRDTWDHLADAAGLAFVVIKELRCF